MGRLDKKVAVITGGASGIGAATVKRFCAEGAAVVIADLNDAGGRELVESIAATGGRATFQRTDVTAEADIRAAIDRAVTTYGRLDVIFNNAGLGGAIGPLEETSVEDWDRTQAVLLRGVFLGIKHAIPHLRAAGGGSIISTASVAGLRGGAGPHSYSAAKAGVVNLTRTAALELAKDSIRVNCICPGGINTPLLTSRFPGGGEALTPLLSMIQPLPRPGYPEDIAAMALFLASDESSFVTGAAMVVDGGFTAGGSMIPMPAGVRRVRGPVVRAGAGEVRDRSQHPTVVSRRIRGNRRGLTVPDAVPRVHRHPLAVRLRPLADHGRGIRGVVRGEVAGLVGQLEQDVVRVGEVDRVPDAVVVDDRRHLHVVVEQSLPPRHQLVVRADAHREVPRPCRRVVLLRSLHALDVEERDDLAAAHREEGVETPLLGPRFGVVLAAHGGDELEAQHLGVEAIGRAGVGGDVGDVVQRVGDLELAHRNASLLRPLDTSAAARRATTRNCVRPAELGRRPRRPCGSRRRRPAPLRSPPRAPRRRAGSMPVRKAWQTVTNRPPRSPPCRSAASQASRTAAGSAGGCGRGSGSRRRRARRTASARSPDGSRAGRMPSPRLAS